MPYDTDKTFKIAYERVKKYVEYKSNGKLIDFKKNKFIDAEEGYKHEILKSAQNSLIRNTWKVEEVGNGDITKYVKRSLQTNIKYKGESSSNNLIDWRKIDDFNKRKFSSKEERLFFDFFKSKKKPEECFRKMEAYDYPYQVIAYLFFINNPQAYSPISQRRFDRIFDNLGIDFKTSNCRSWENYSEFNQIIKNTRKLLSKKHPNINLLDAHSFLWIYGTTLEGKDINVSSPEESNLSNNTPTNNSIDSSIIKDEDIESKNTEGKEKYKLHRTLERDSSIGKIAKKKRLQNEGSLSCDVCGFDFLKVYGEIGEGYIEAHHTIPVSEIREARKTKLSEIALVCANCHRMLHRQSGKTLSIHDLKLIISNTKST